MTQTELKEISFKPKQTIFKEGDTGGCFYIIQQGEVEISTVIDGEKVVISKANNGDSIGEFAFVTKKPRSATATALTDVTVVVVSAEVYKKLFDEIPFWAQAMIEELVKKLVGSTELIKKNQAKNKELINALDIILE